MGVISKVAGLFKKKPAVVGFGYFNKRAVWVVDGPDGIKRSYDPYDVDRKIRSYGNGDGWVESITILKASADAEAIPELRDQAVAARKAAFDDIAALSRKVFGLTKLSDDGKSGWTDGEAFAVFSEYLISIMQIGDEFLPLPKSLARPAG